MLQDKLRSKDTSVMELETDNQSLASSNDMLRSEIQSMQSKYEDQIKQLRISSEIVDKEQNRIISQLRSVALAIRDPSATFRRSSFSPRSCCLLRV